MFYAQKKDNYVLLILLFSLLALIGIGNGIDILEYGIDSNETPSVPEQPIQPGRNSPGNEDLSLGIDNNRDIAIDIRSPTQITGFRSIHVSDSSQKPSFHLGFPAHGPITITSNAGFASHPNITGSGTAGDPYIF